MRSLRMVGLVAMTFLLATLPVAAAARYRAGFAVYPAIRPWGWYGPFGYGVYRPFGFYGPYEIYGINTGELKLDTNVKNAEVYINGAYAGTADKLKSFWLLADAYNLEVRAPGHKEFNEKIFIVAGKTMRVHAVLPLEPH